MVKVTTGVWGSSADMSVADFSDFEPSKPFFVSEDTIKVKLHGGVTVVRGEFDLNSKGQLVGGTAEFIRFGFGPYEGMTWSGLEIGLRKFDKIYNSDRLSDDASLFDRIFQGDDRISGSDGDDILKGGLGDDIIAGKDGADLITGGLGADTFFYDDDFNSNEQSGIDIIMDFSQAEGDKISLRDVGFFDFATEIRITSKNGDTVIEVDTIGGFSFPMIIRVDGEVALTEADFIL